MNNFYTDDYITFEEKYHRYFNPDGIEFMSMSKILKGIQIPFDREGMSKRIAKSRNITQAEVLKEWDKKRDDSIDHGNNIHNGMENYFRAEKVSDPKVEKLAKYFARELDGYKQIIPEKIFYDEEYLVAGQADLVLDRGKGKNWVVDIFDYKTNLEKGICFDSISRKKSEPKDYKKFLLDPVSHLEECNYNIYSLQLSGYAYMMEKTYGIKPGKLFIVYIYEKNGILDYRLLPVNYMKYEVQAIFETNKKLYKLD